MGLYKSFIISVLLVVFGFVRCSSDRVETETTSLKHGTEHQKPVYLNHHDSVEYIGMDQCKLCHTENHKTFIHTGMGSSFGLANPEKSSAVFNTHSTLYDKDLNLYYQPRWEGETLVLKEFRLSENKKDTVYSRNQIINYIVGSGQHTNSHMVDANGYVTQAPFTYYTQDGHLDFPPGFENGNNTRFSRKIGLECMSCHNGLPDFVLGSENKYNKVPMGIDCERCHGPGELHLKQFQNGQMTDTSKFIDYTIVNPGKLSPELQFDLCSRCHLQGNMVLKEGKNFYDFKPGMKLSEVLDVFLPKYTDSDEKFIMASHVDRLKMSACFTKAEGMTCITCHNPHVSVKETQKAHFDQVCKSCHEKEHQTICTEEKSKQSGQTCVSCHMPKTGSSDIPHVRITDHKIAIQKENTSGLSQQTHEFLNLYCVNNENPDTLTLIKAYLQQYERFEVLDVLLSKAEALLATQPFSIDIFEQYVHLHFLQQKGDKSLMLIDNLPKGWMNDLEPSFDNKNAWMLYRLAKAYAKKKEVIRAKAMYAKAVELAPYHLDIRLSYGKDLLEWRDVSGAQSQLKFIIKENPNYELAYTPLAYSYALQQNFLEAEKLYKRVLNLNPNDFHAQSNLAGLYVMKGDVPTARKLLNAVLKEHPDFGLAKQMMSQLP